MSGHSAHDAADYVPKGLLEDWSRRDPILMLQKFMVEEHGADEQDFVNIRRAILAEIDEAVEWALAQPFPDPATVEDDVYQ